MEVDACQLSGCVAARALALSRRLRWPRRDARVGLLRLAIVSREEKNGSASQPFNNQQLAVAGPPPRPSAAPAHAPCVPPPRAPHPRPRTQSHTHPSAPAVRAFARTSEQHAREPRISQPPRAGARGGSVGVASVVASTRLARLAFTVVAYKSCQARRPHQW